jgi:signal transduction histidine kinase/ActR/RegA family two-component response regulator
VNTSTAVLPRQPGERDSVDHAAKVRGSLWLRITITLALIAFFGHLRLGVYPEQFVPLTSVLPLLVCLWHRDLRLLWGMAGIFAVMILYKVSVLVPDTVAMDESMFAGMQFANLVIAAIVIDKFVRLANRLEVTVDHLNESNAELDASNEELAAREEEITQQNEELQLQTEELEQQAEELSSQTEELQSLNEDLTQRERTLRDLLDTTAEGIGEDGTLALLAHSIQRLLGQRAAGAAILELGDDEQLVVSPLFGLEEKSQRIRRGASLAQLVLSRDRVGALGDVADRPDLDLPVLAGGQPVRALASAPVTLEQESLGVLEVYAVEPGEWPEHELRMLQWFAMQCSRMLAISTMRAEREALLEAEKAARTEADRANRAKDEFVAMLSHELRTPLHAVLGWATLLRDGSGMSPDEVKKGLDIIERNARQQGQLISDLLDINRIVTGKLHLELKPVDLAAIVESTTESLREQTESKGIRLERKLPALQQTVVGDSTRLQQIIWNLLSNAVKFTAPGGRVDIELLEHPAHVDLIVRDNGEGIEKEQLPHLFERYRQADASPTRRHGGLGLGLAIVKDLAELHGGTVEAVSDGPGRGATFIVRLPVRTEAWLNETPPRDAETQAPAPSAVVELSGLTILVVDDEKDARHLVAHILARHGADVHEAASGDEALQILQEIRADVLVSDIAMPGMDGYELIRGIRNRAASNGDQRIPRAVALTAFARPEDRARALLAGYELHLAKPIEADALLKAVSSLWPDGGDSG